MMKIIKNLGLIIIIASCFKLALWQIDRAEQKILIQNDFSNQAKEKPINIKRISSMPKRFTNISATGYFKEPYFLLDNIVFNRKAGYHVISPLSVEGKVLLVNRGWVENFSRQKFPDIKKIDEIVVLVGYAYYPSKLLELTSENITATKPYVIQNIDIEQISKVLNAEVYPYVLVLKKDSRYSYIHNHSHNTRSHLKHYMYAGQWFLFSLIGVIFIVLLNRRDNG